MLEPGILVTIGITLLGGVVWAVRIEGRVNAHQTLFDEREKQLAERHAELQSQLQRIEGKLDRYETRASSQRQRPLSRDEDNA